MAKFRITIKGSCLKIIIIVLGQLISHNTFGQLSIRASIGTAVDRLTTTGFGEYGTKLMTTYKYSAPAPFFSFNPVFRFNEKFRTSLELNYTFQKRNAWTNPGGFNPMTFIYYRTWQLTYGAGVNINTHIYFDVSFGVANTYQYKYVTLYEGEEKTNLTSVNNAIIRLSGGYSYRNWTINMGVVIPVKSFQEAWGIVKRYSLDITLGRRFDFKKKEKASRSRT